MSARTTKKLRSSSGSSKGRNTGRSGKRRKPSYTILYSAAAVLVLLILSAVVYRCSTGGRDYGSIREISIEHGTSVHEISQILRREGVIGSAWGFRRYVRQQEIDRNLQAGTYMLPQGLAVSEAADILSRGYLRYTDLVVFPGLTISEISQRISLHTGIAQQQILNHIEQEAESRGFPFAEGFFFPGTYRIPLDGFSPSLVIGEAFDRFRAWQSMHQQEIAQSPYTTEQLVITASMIQREAGSIAEMPVIAGIIWRRLELGMPLGIDATTRYELDDWQNPLRREDLERRTPFNTRRNTGLPPTGISNPGYDALMAALRPEHTPYLYYLHDQSGRIHYGRTYQEHLDNIGKYLRQR